MRTIFYVLLLVLAWWVGASGAYTVTDLEDTITAVRER